MIKERIVKVFKSIMLYLVNLIAPNTRTEKLVYVRIVDDINQYILSKVKISKNGSVWKISPVAFYPMIGLISFLSLEAFLKVVGETSYTLTNFLIVFGLGLYISICISYRRMQVLLADFSIIMGLDLEWVDTKMNNIFTFQKYTSVITTFLVAILSIIVINYLGLPYPTIPDFIKYIAIIIIALIGGHGVAITVEIYVTLYEMGRIKPIMDKTKLPFFRLPNPNLKELYGFLTFRFSMIMVFAYFWLLIALIFSPYGFHPVFFPMMLFLAFFPFPAFVFSYNQIRQISANIRDYYVLQANMMVDKAFNELRENSSSDKIEQLSKLMDFQKRIEQISISPFQIGVIFFGAISGIGSVLQVIVTLSNIVSF